MTQGGLESILLCMGVHRMGVCMHVYAGAFGDQRSISDVGSPLPLFFETASLTGLGLTN